MKKSEIIKIALECIGATNINQLDGGTFIINDIWYNIYVDDNKIRICIV